MYNTDHILYGSIVRYNITIQYGQYCILLYNNKTLCIIYFYT